MAWIRRLLGQRRSRLEGHEIDWSPGKLVVTFPGGRMQQVSYQVEGGRVRLATTVLSPREVRRLKAKSDEIAHLILRRNRATRMVAFGLGRSDAIEAWIVTPHETLQRAELLHYLIALAREGDRFEFLLGRHDRG